MERSLARRGAWYADGKVRRVSLGKMCNGFAVRAEKMGARVSSVL